MRNKFLGSTIAIILGALLLSSSQLNGLNGATGIAIIFGALAYMARKKQNIKHSNKWRIVEIISIIFVLLNIILGLRNNNWYNDPIVFVIVPLWSVIAYLIILRKRNG